jgi:CheY-like chemotaxis protein
MSAEPAPGPAAPKAKILVVDDDLHIRSLLIHILEGNGYEVRSAQNGGEALQMIGSYNPDLVVLDVNMPQVDGWNVLAAVRSNPRTQNLRVLMCTNNDAIGDVEKASLLGATDYIPKPFQLDRLLRTVHYLLTNPPA